MSEIKHLKRFSEVKNSLSGKKISISDIVNTDIEVHGFKIVKTKFKDAKNADCCIIGIKVNGVNRIIFTSSRILIKQCLETATAMPFIAQIQKKNKYYMFV